MGFDELKAYARAAALLADPFVDRGASLAQLGMDETSWQRLDAQWRMEIARRAAVGDRAFADAFAAAFERQRQEIEWQRHGTAQLRDGDAPASPTATAERGPATELDGTAIAQVRLAPALPFAGQRPPPPPVAPATEPGASAAYNGNEDAGSHANAGDDDLDATGLIDGDADLDTTLPFVDPTE